MHPFTDRANSLGSGITFSFYGRLASDLFTCEKLLLPKTKVRIKLIRARPNFYMLSDKPNVSLKSVDCSLFTRKFLVAEPNHQYLQWHLEREPAQYNYVETIARTFIFPSRQNQFIQLVLGSSFCYPRISKKLVLGSSIYYPKTSKS